jgi:hypothetical protein
VFSLSLSLPFNPSLTSASAQAQAKPSDSSYRFAFARDRNRLRELVRHLEHGQVPPEVLKKTLQYAACVLDTVSMDETR